MQFFWRSDARPLATYSSWVDELDDKNRKQGTSAPTLAAAWSGPLDLLGALATHPDLAKLDVRRVTVEAKASFDTHGGNVRNHDLVLRAATAGGEPVVVCVEAKAGETLGATVAEQAQAAERAVRANSRSKAAGTARRPRDTPVSLPDRRSSGGSASLPVAHSLGGNPLRRNRSGTCSLCSTRVPYR
jgi:hypothetical protein